MKLTVTPQRLPEVLLLTHDLYGDERGFFAEVFRESLFAENGLPRFVQENHSRSRRGVLRGLHYQKEPEAIGKLVRCARGRIFDVAVDIRKGSPTFARWVAAELSAEAGTMLYVPPGFAHGFCTLSDEADVIYKVTGYYAPDCDRGIRWDDPAIGIAWPVRAPELSGKDAAAPLLAEADNNFVYGVTT